MQESRVFFAVEKIPCEEKDDKDISKLVSGIVKCSINRQISYKTVGADEVRLVFFPFVSYFSRKKKKWPCLLETKKGTSS